MKLSEKETKILVSKIGRAETLENPRIYFKAVRVTLYSLGYDEDWIENIVRPMIEEMYEPAFRI